MMLESLFARDGQGQACLWLAVCGVIFGALVHGAEFMRRKGAWWGAAGDVLCTLALSAMLLGVLLGCGGGLRGYGLLGFAAGALLYMAGVKPAVETVMKLFRQRSEKSTGRKEGFLAHDAEMITNEESGKGR